MPKIVFNPVHQEELQLLANKATDIELENISGATYRNVQQMQDVYHSTGQAAGGLISDNGDGTYSVAAGSGYIRATNDPTDTLLAFDWDAAGPFTPANNAIRYVGIEYNAGSPQVVQRTTRNWNLQTEFPLGQVVLDNGVVHILNAPQGVGDHAGKMIEAMKETMAFARDRYNGGLLISESADTNRNVALTAGAVWFGLNEFAISSIDTAVSGSFQGYYRDGSGGWSVSTGLTQWNNSQYDDGTGTLATMTSARYAVNWFYLDVEGNGELVMLYPQNQYNTVAQAEEEGTPQDIPPRVRSHCILVGRIIYQKDNTTAASVHSAFNTSFSIGGVANHNDLSGLQGGTSNEYYHLTAARHTDLTDGGDSTLHFHSSDRNRANHTGTQAASTISDFDTEVANNSAVAANTAKISADGSINTHSDVDTSTDAPQRDEVLKWNGSEWVPAAYDASFAMTIASFTDNQASPQLIGSGTWQSSGAITFTASYNNPPPDSASIAVSGTGVSGGFPITLSSPYTSGANTANTSYPSAKDVTVTFTLTAYDGATPRTSTTTVLFRNYIRWGTLTKNTGITSADLLTLSGSQLSNDQTQSKSIVAGSGEYLVWAYPASYTSLNANGLIFNNVTCPFQAVATVSHTNEAGFTENYKVYASTNANLGSSTLTTSTSSTLINSLYYGVTTAASGYSEADVEGLANSTITNDNTQTWSEVTAAAGEYLLFAFPVRLGSVVFYVGGFEGGFESPETVSVTNVNGYTEDYYVWRSTNSGLGATTVETRSS